MNNEQFLSFFPESVIQFFDDNASRKSEMLAETKSNYNEAKIKQKQEQGCGSYFSVNGFSKGKRTKDNLSRFNAVYIDLDISKEKDLNNTEAISNLKTIALKKVINGPLKPNFIIETKNGLQCLWLIENYYIEEYSQTEEALINYYGADSGAKDVCRVLRLPETYHLKNPADPFLCKLIFENIKDNKKYNFNDFTSNYDFSGPVKIIQPYKQNLTTSNNILKAKSLPIKWVIELCAAKAAIQITWQENSNGTFQIIENNRITSGFINPITNIAYSSSGKTRKGDSVSIAKYYLCEISKSKANSEQIASWLLYAANKQ